MLEFRDLPWLAATLHRTKHNRPRESRLQSTTRRLPREEMGGKMNQTHHGRSETCVELRASCWHCADEFCCCFYSFSLPFLRGFFSLLLLQVSQPLAPTIAAAATAADDAAEALVPSLAAPGSATYEFAGAVYFFQFQHTPTASWKQDRQPHLICRQLPQC